ncbi:Rv0909 family putative TA system antitoxin [Corynebacterium sp.]|uniref:Rv0909 family putative TA system antitoxin n=1 Tax=Corynebacterium sp. TaxID=1720 RepID=UPI0026DC93D7|nr:Rv0909 family putative TA system antitoxin [Corynebacterium sp.]MDO5077417.1 Rv0909 family putative TA system antitoxin [Corynebacterium sp.]
MGIFDSAKQKAQDALKSEKATDAALDKGEDLAKNKFGADKADHVSKARQAIDDRVGE